MKRKVQTVLTLLVSLALIFVTLSGCGKESSKTSEQSTPAATQAEKTAAQTSEQTAGGGGSVKLPLTDKPVTFKAFRPIDRAEQDMSKNAAWKLISEKTGIKFEWECPVGNEAASETYKLMLASQQLPDLVFETTSVSYPGGLEKAVDDGIYLDLREKLQKFAPLYWEKLNGNKAALRDAVTDKGYIPGIYQIQELHEDKPGLLMGMVLRGDWLEDLKLPVPKTLDDWYVTLKAFKEQKNCDFPLLYGPTYGMDASGIFLSAFGISAAPVGPNTQVQMFYPDANGKMRYGAIEPGFQEYLQMMSKWYKEGLYDRDFATRSYYDLPGRAKLVANNQAGATPIFLEWMGMFTSSAKDPTFKLVAAPMPSKTAGEPQRVSVTRAKYLYDPLCITTACKEPDLAVRLINYLCTEEGNLLINFGIEGDTYTMVDGKPRLTDKVLKSDFGPLAALEVFTGNYQPFRLQSSTDVTKQLNSEEILSQKQVFYDSADPVYLTYQVNAEEGKRLSSIMGDIITYTSEQIVRAIMNPDVAAKWMDVQAKQIKSMNIDEAIAIVQGAYDRYMARK